ERLARPRGLPCGEIRRAAAVREPAHDDLVAADDLLAVDAEVLPAALGMPRGRQPPRDQRARVAGPAGLDRPRGKIDVVALDPNLLRLPLPGHARRHVHDLFE